MIHYVRSSESRQLHEMCDFINLLVIIWIMVIGVIEIMQICRYQIIFHKLNIFKYFIL